MAAADGTITLAAACHCRGFSARYTLPASAFPLKAAICSCTSCRHVTGQLWGSFAVMPLGHDSAPTGPTLVSYAFSRNLTVLFCGVCGATVANIEPGEWEFATGVLSVVRGAQGDETREDKGAGIQGLLDRQCMFAEDVEDGGGLVWLPGENSAGREMKRHSAHRTSKVIDVDAVRRDFDARRGAGGGAVAGEGEERLHGKCHCGRVKFFITRPTPAGEPAADSKRGKWWLADPDDPQCNKYRALLDACDSCRLVTGFEFNAWTYVPAVNVFAEDTSGASGGAPRPFDPHDTALDLGRHTSSEDNWRFFCKNCGAPICFWTPKREVNVLDFGVGLFNGDGARCEDWMRWRGLEYSEDAMDKKLATGIGERMGIWKG